MATVFEIGLANAVVAAFLGAGTFLVGRWLRRPAVIHVLWIVVLVKLITPPLFLVPLPSLCLAESPREVENGSTGPLSESRSQTGVPKPESVGLPAAAFEPNVPGISVLEDFGAEPDDNPFQQPQAPPNLKSAKIENEPVAATVPPKVIGRNGGTASVTEIPRATAGSLKTNPPQAWRPKLRSMALQGLSLVWIVGSLAFIGLMGLRIRRFRRLLGPACSATSFWMPRLMGLRIRRFRRLLGQAGVPAPEELCRELVGLARSMGLSRVPKLVLVPGTVSPLVWAVDLRPVIVFPQGLLERLDALGRRSLLLHELTHLRRRDHWVRGLELIVGCLYWWLPLVWLARRELQQAEEECCDAWVVWWMEGERRPYALALLQTLDFLDGVPAEMPPAASGLGHVAFLRQRLKGILREDIPRSMGWREMLAIVLCSLMVLPVIPSWGQSGEEPPAGAVITPNAEAISNTPSEKESNPAPLSTAAIVAKQVDYRAVPMLDSIDFQPQSQTFPPVVQYAQGSAFSGDGRWLITVYGRPHETGEVRIWNVATHEEQAMWKEPIGMRSVAMAPDGKTFAYGTYGGVIQLGDIETGKRLTAWDAIPTGIESLSFSADGRWLVAGTSEGVVHVWEVATAKITQTLKGHKGRVYAVGFLPDNATILSSGFDKTLKFWERSNGHMIRSVEQPDQVFSLAVAPDGKRVATACQDGRVRLFDPTGEPQTTLTPPQGAVSVAFAPSGKTLAVSHGGTVSLWNVNTGQSLAVIQANQEVVHQVAISRDGKTLATTSWDRSVKFWNLETQAELATLLPAPKTHDEPQSIQAVAWSPDNSWVASAHEDNSVRVREGSTGEVLAVLKGHEDSVSDLKFSPDGKRLATASYDNSVKLWAMPPKAMEAGQKRSLAIEPLLTLNGHDNWVMCLAFSPDGTRLASGSYDKTIRIWDVRGGQELQKREGHTAAVRSLVFLSKDRFASAGSDRSIKLWDLNSSQELATLKQHTGAVRALSYSPQSQRLASASEDKTIKLWDLSQFKPESAEQPLPEPQTLQGHAGMIWSLAFSRSGSVLASGDLTGQIKIWDPATGKERMTLKGHTDIVSTLAFDRNGRFLISGSYDKRLLLWKGNVPLPTLTELATIAKPENRVRIAVVSPDGRWLALSGGTQSTELRDLHDLKADPVLLNQRKSSSHLAFSPDSRLIAIGTYSGEIKLWNLHEKKWLSDLVRHDGQVQRVAFAPNGKRLASVGWDHVLKLWDLTEHKLLATSAIEPLLMSDVAFSPDGKTLATCSGNWKEWRTPGEVKLWSVEPLKELKVLGGHEQEIRGVAFTSKGDRLVSYSSSSTGTTKVWDLTTDQELGRFAGCAALTLLPSGRHAVTGDLYGKMRLFDLVTFQPLLSFTGHKDLIYTLSPSPDGSLVASVCRDGAVTLWPTSPNLEQGEPQ